MTKQEKDQMVQALCMLFWSLYEGKSEWRQSGYDDLKSRLREIFKLEDEPAKD